MFGRKKEEVAKPMKACIYPRCNECEHYHVTSDGINVPTALCDVPIVVTKQMYLDVQDMMGKLFVEVGDINEYLCSLHAEMKKNYAPKEGKKKK